MRENLNVTGNKPPGRVALGRPKKNKKEIV
jgi:hypothetical protein